MPQACEPIPSAVTKGVPRHTLVGTAPAGHDAVGRAPWVARHGRPQTRQSNAVNPFIGSACSHGGALGKNEVGAEHPRAEFPRATRDSGQARGLSFGPVGLRVCSQAGSGRSCTGDPLALDG